jgi:hypothetical protein
VLEEKADFAASRVLPVDEYQRRFAHIAELVAEEYALIDRRDARGASATAGPKPRVPHYFARSAVCAGPTTTRSRVRPTR